MIDLKDIHPQLFKTAAEFEEWLSQHFSDTDSVWLKMYKKATGLQSVNYADALDVALCYGWIDGIAKSWDELSYVQRFTPRRSKSVWSKVNREHIARLTKAGRMQPSGLAAVAAAKADGRWEQAYDSPAHATIPDDFMVELKKNKAAYEFFQTLNKSNRFAISWRLQTAKKPETRQNRMIKMIETLSRNEKLV